MALTRKMLTAMGLEAEKIDQIIEAHAETVNGLKDEINKHKEQAERLPEVQKELDDLKKSQEGKDYDKLKKEFDDYKSEVQEKETKAAKEKAYREALKDANLTEKGIEKALKYADWSSVELDEDGALKNAKEHVKAVREEWAEYISKTTQQGAQTSKPPVSGGKTYKNKDEILGIKDTAERQKAISENHDLFGF